MKDSHPTDSVGNLPAGGLEDPAGTVLVLAGTTEGASLDEGLSGLGCDHRVRRMASPEELLAAVQSQLAVVLIDLDLLDEPERFVRQVATASPHAPIVVLAGPGREELLLSALRLGAHDYAVDGETSAATLRLALRNAVERALVECRLRESEERYRTFFENDLTADFITTPDGGILDCNPAFVRMFGFQSREHALGCDTRWIYPDPVERAELMRLLCARRRLEGIALKLCRIDGTPLHVIENIVGHFDDDGELTGLQGFIFDITDRVQLEEHLRHTQKIEAVGRLAGGVAHDFNNLLTVIQGNAQLLLMAEEKAGHSVRGELSEIAETAKRGATLTRQLLAFSRKQVVQPQRVDLSDLVENLENLLARLCGETVGVRKHLATDLWRIKADVGQLESVVINLVVNARDAVTGAGTIDIRTTNVRLEPEATDFETEAIPGTVDRPPGEYVRLSVTDDGTGIEPECLARIFEPFFTTKEVSKGTGLGLSTVLDIVETNQGFVEVDSVPGRGTTLHVSIPRAEPLAREVRERERATLTAPLAGGTETILVAEDEGAVRGYVTRVLEQAGYSVITARSAEEALSVLDGNPSVDLLLSDTIMPGMNGRRLAEEAVTRRADLRVLLMSGFIEDETVQQFVESGGAFIGKPFAPNDLTEKIRQTLDR